MGEDLELTPPAPVVNEIFLKGIKTGQQFYFSDDENEEIMTKDQGLFYVDESGRKAKGSGMAKCIVI